MKKIFALALCVMGTLSLFAETPVIDWSKIDWLGNGTGNAAYDNKYKISMDEGQQVANVQNSSKQGNKPSIYTWFGSGVNDCTAAYDAEGSGVWIHVEGLTQQVTEVTVDCALQSYTFYVYYSQGTTTDLEEKPSTLNMPNSSKFIQNGRLMIQTPQGTFSVLGQIK